MPSVLIVTVRTVTINTDGISEEGRDYELTLYVDNVQVASSQDAGIEFVWNLEGVADGLHYIRVEGRDAEGYEDSRESVVLVGDYVGLLNGVSPNPFNRLKGFGDTPLRSPT